VVPAGSFDLSLKKYVANTTSGREEHYGDHQTTNDGTDVDRDILNVPQGGSMRYKFFVQNLGPVTATGLTTVEDTLPNDTSIVDASGTGWTCTLPPGGRSFICSRNDTLAVGATFPEIVVNVRASATIPAGEYSNIATVRNPGDTNPNNNTDPANIQILV
jgi:large repetitive protein